jgi:phosphoglycolate phosphatase
MKLCILFPGIGYHCDKPLLYYTGKLARSKGYEVKALKYSGFDTSVKDNEDKMRNAAKLALSQSKAQLADIDLSVYEKIIFIGKSIGTVACLAYREDVRINAECVLLTPLLQTFEMPSDNCTAFHGTADQWADTSALRTICQQKNVPLCEYDEANHSLETGDVMTDLKYLRNVIEKIERLL